MVSNLGRKLEEEFKNREEKGAILSRREDILENLNDIGTVTEELVEKVNKEDSIETLKKWLKISARVKSLDELIEKISYL